VRIDVAAFERWTVDGVIAPTMVVLPPPPPDPGAPKARKSRASAEPGAPRRKRCKACVGCLAPQCGTCKFCLDMISRGGPGKLKKPCEKRVCVEIGKSH